MDAQPIRRATHDDYEAVKAISGEVYDGMDYLLAGYHDLIDSTNCEAFVYEVEGQVVGFNLVWLADGGRTLIRRGGRVRAEHQGRGVFLSLVRYIHDRYAALPDVTHEAIAVSNVVYDKRPGFFLREFQEIQVKMASLFSFQSDDVDHEMLQMRKSDVVDSAGLKNILSNPDLCPAWFPDERMVVSWVPYRLMSENVAVIMKPNMYIVADQSDTSAGRGLMTAGGSYFISGTLLYYLDIYGTNTATLSNHIAAHIQHIINMNVTGVNLITYVHPTIPSKTIEDTMGLFGLSVNTMFYDKVYLLERALNKG